MPYFTKEYCESLKGKTIEKIEPITSPDNHTITIHFTDGSKIRIDAYAEHIRVTQRTTLVVNKENPNAK